MISPTYFGALGDVRALAAVAHRHGVPLIVDEAWGAHLAFHEELPEHALAAGADLVISSTHKIVGSLTQSAMLHLGQDPGRLLDEDVVDRAVTLTESTSPSSLLTASLDAARRQAAVHGRQLLGHTIEVLADTRRQIRSIDGLDVLDERLAGRAGVFAYDPLRLAVDVRGIAATGYELAPLLREIDDINLELSAPERDRCRVRHGRAHAAGGRAAGGGARRGSRARRRRPLWGGRELCRAPALG